ncbi:MAG: BTAD domain-containing putative transcriptional regulator [Acidiferrobacterales bacterium]
MPDRLRFTLLGGLDVRWGSGPPLAFATRKARALLTYLALAPSHTRSREQLSTVLWGRSAEEQARASLRQTLSSLRKSFEKEDPKVLIADAESVALDTTSIEVDVLAFERCVADGTPEALQKAGEIYAGDFLEGFSLQEESFEEWLMTERRRLQALAIRALSKLLAQHEEAGAYERGVQVAEKLLALDPLQEAVHRALMRLLARQGQRALALKQYETCRGALQRELGVAPESTTEALYKEILQQPEQVVTPEKPRAVTATGKDFGGRPTLAVLPLRNMSQDPGQEYFADGITEDLITALSSIRWLRVIARNSTFTYKGQSPDLKDVANDLGVRYVLQGSVRRAANRVRITAQLVDTASGTQVWANRYDRDREDMFALQDELSETIVGAIEPELGKAERQRARFKRPGSLDAWDMYQRGLAQLYQYTNESLAEAQRLFQRAMELEPDLSAAYSASAEAYYIGLVYGLAESPDENRERALVAARRAVELDSDDAAAHCTLGRVYYLRREHEVAIPELEIALSLNPSFAWAHYGIGAALVFSGRAKDALPHLENAIRLSPRDPYMGSFLVRMADARLFMQRCEDAIAWAKKALRQPHFQWSRHAVLISALAHRGDVGEARDAVAKLLKLRPDFTLAFVRKYHLISDSRDMAFYLEGLRKAGIPEGT